MQTQTIQNSSEPDLTSEEGLRAHLVAALDEEVELLEGLRRIFTAQRDALRAGDPTALDDGVFSATRVMRTMEEARRRRRRLTMNLLGSDLEFDELDTVLTGSRNRPVRLARERVRAAAAQLRTEVGMLQRILKVALQDNRVHLETLLGDGVHRATSEAAYGTGEGDARAASSGVVVDRTV